MPSDWVQASTTSRGRASQGKDYGYQWWLYNEDAARSYLDGHDDIFFAIGRGGQFVWVLPWARIVIACTAWNDANGYWPEPLLWDFIGPAIRR